ncbi:MAG: c-type cytochrome [Pseudomonadales bacterium]
MLQSVILFGLVGLALVACSEAPPARQPDTTSELATSFEPVVLSPRQAQMWSRSCALCHVDGTAFAPRMGVDEEWAQRLAQGQDVLLQHTLEGFNDMPPLGYCMACEREDFIALIEFMSQIGGSP